MEICDGVYVLKLEFEMGNETHVFHPVLVKRNNGLVLIDTGLEQTVEQLRTAVEATGNDVKDIDLVVLTHQDIDHVGGAQYVREQSGALILAPRNEVDIISGKAAPRFGEKEAYPAVEVDIEACEGMRFATTVGPAEILDTPGHTAGHQSVYIGRCNLLIAADALVVENGVLMGPSPHVSVDLHRAADSLSRLGEHKIEWVSCYHGGVVSTNDAEIARIAADTRELAGR
ncbi:MAG: MBL fold metallo-hydrolase [Desulfofustis sp. PB-SRB1]|jgi:glyoxylase-like metal-dependent hydrolase (beta-lactamase superfamily II)|nr:MBL fold metallo-hydrolase [Desulfofustis sp. PB-SRB1]MBM1002898.1 MBL fold metallo-hydrolase [Desulfofustis sp. PB-SRB1]HBH30006.1 MBL fold metallo-hydrolase [Desulfofustis sp.]